MRINWHTLKTLPVVTKSGTPVGKISDLTIDSETEMIVCLHVKRSRLSKELLLVHRSQVLSITEKQVVVDDTAILIEEKKPDPASKRSLGDMAAFMQEKEGV